MRTPKANKEAERTLSSVPLSHLLRGTPRARDVVWNTVEEEGNIGPEL
jgi:hypothetical protein